MSDLAVSTLSPEELQHIRTIVSDSKRLDRILLCGSLLNLILDLALLGVYIRRMTYKQFALLIFALVLMAQTSFIAGSALSLSSFNSYEQLKHEQQIEVWKSAHNKYSDAIYNVFQLNLFGFVCICSSYFLFTLQYWQLSLRLEAACRISVY